MEWAGKPRDVTPLGLSAHRLTHRFIEWKKAHMSRTSSKLSAAVAMAYLLSASGPALALDGSDARPEFQVGPDADLAQDAAEYASSFDVSLAEAERRLTAQQQLKPSMAAAELVAGSRFAGMWTEHTPSYRAVILLTGVEPAPPELVKIAAEAPTELAIVTNAEHSMAELVSGLERIGAELSTAAPETASGLDVQAGEIQLSGPAIAPSVLSAIREQAGVPVRYEIRGDMTLLHTYGGRKITSTSSATLCTTGFTVRQIETGNQGVTTAGHCGNTGITYHQTSTITYPMTYLGQRFDNDQDFQWSDESGHGVYAKIWDGDSYRSVTDGTAPSLSTMLNDFVCHYGIQTGYSCGTVRNTNYDPGNICGPNGSSDCYPSWVLVQSSTDALKCFGGDSGGPWFSGGVAYGILQAGVTSGTGAGDCDAATFMTTHFLNISQLYVLEE